MKRHLERAPNPDWHIWEVRTKTLYKAWTEFSFAYSCLPLREEEADGLALDQIVFGLEPSPDHVPIPRADKLIKALVQAVFRGFAEQSAHAQELISSAKQI